MRQFLSGWRVEDGYLILKNTPKKASKLWIEYDRDLSETTTPRIYTNFIVNQKKYFMPIFDHMETNLVMNLPPAILYSCYKLN